MLDYGRTATTTMTSYTKAKRSHSMPSRYMMPSKELGEYDTEPGRRRSAPARPSSGMLFPLSEEGGSKLFRKSFNYINVLHLTLETLRT